MIGVLVIRVDENDFRKWMSIPVSISSGFVGGVGSKPKARVCFHSNFSLPQEYKKVGEQMTDDKK